jgi:diguanylate cyclase (GGDEF)-like protein
MQSFCMAESLLAWRARHAETLYRLYAVVLFALFAFVMRGAWAAHEFVLHLPADGAVIAAWYWFSLFIVLQGFLTPRGAYVSLDRITQLGLVLLLSPADAALINCLASLSYPLIAQRKTYGLRGACFRSLHNAAMFGFTIYFAGKAYAAAGGALQIASIDQRGALAFGVLVLAAQLLNGVFLRLRALVTGVHRSWAVDWFSHAIEVPVSAIGLLLALVYSRMDAVALALFIGLLVAIVTIAKFLNSVTLKLKQRKEELEQKVQDRVADIERQGMVLVAVNKELEASNRRQVQLLASLQATTEELERQNREDALTGLFSRRHMDQFLHREHERAMRLRLPLSVAMIDIDHFKAVNDTFTHQVGDTVLKIVADLLVANVRALDLVARYGGEEILLCMPDTPLAEARVVCERARLAIEAYEWRQVVPGLRLTASFGIAQQDGAGVADLLRACDLKLYEAKNGGRNQVRV